MRIWIGKEMEGRYKGVSTMFIESDIINSKVLNVVTQYIEDYPVNVLYFGAGRVNVKSIDYNCFAILDNLKKLFMLSIEFDKDGTEVPSLYCFDSNVYRTMTSELNFKNLSLKIDTEKEVYTQSVDCMFRTNLNSLQDCKFIGTDIEIYNDKQEE